MKEKHLLIIATSVMISGLFTLVSLCVIAAVIYSNQLSVADITTFLTKSVTFVTTIAGLIAAITAFRGVTTWRKQLKYGKHVDLIWEAMNRLRATHHAYILWRANALIYASNLNEIEDLEPYEKDLKEKLDQLGASFNWLDTIVIQNEWQWANYHSDLNLGTKRVINSFKSNIYGPTMFEHKTNSVDEFYKSLAEKLVVLEKQYI
ncbi:hypothetical protein R50073_17950 [Maricurvus nonylphenolicus]|uniref:hypothetical protein n=1 Tax=Maricurvus nonylphenolicus TaxID=1008307 RepID=UPI0036F2649A